jgi:hypothetical protein
MSILSALLGWFFIFLAIFIAIGHPAPGPDQVRKEEIKTLVMMVSLFLSTIFMIAGVTRAIRSWRDAKIQGGVSLFLFFAWLLGLLWLVLSA